MVYTEVPKSVATFMETITENAVKHIKIGQKLSGGLANTLLTTVKRQEDGTTFY